jgi:very-short-patch-repair endonuclease
VDHRDGVQRSFEALAASQYGVIARDQALSFGFSRRMIERRTASGAWEVVLRGVYRVAAAPRSARQFATAATLWSAPEGLVSHDTAGVLWRLEGIKASQTHLTLPATRRLTSSRLVVHRARDLLPVDVAYLGPIRLTSPLRTAIDLAALVDAATLEIAIESALRRRLFSVGQLRWRAGLLMGTGRTGSPKLRTLLDRRGLGRTESGWEVKVSQLLEESGLDAPVRQHVVRAGGRVVARVDLAYPDRRVAIEYDSDAWHSGVDRRHRDAERRNRLRALGWTVVEVTPAQLRAPAQLLEVLRAVLAA